jgi:hypothetical protein
MNRREFFGATAAGMAGLSGAGFAWAQAADPKVDWKKIRPATLDRIAIMTLNFQSILKVPDTQPSPNRTLELSDIGEMLADTYGVHKVEFQHYHLASVEPSYFKDLRNKLEKSKSRATQINLEFSGLNISAPQNRDRLLAIDLTKMWIDHAVTLGAQRVMINQGQPTQENKIHSIPTLKAMVDYGKSKNIIVSVETRGSGGGGGRGRGGQGGQAQGGQGAAPAAPQGAPAPGAAAANPAPANAPAPAPGAAAPTGQPGAPAGPPSNGPDTWPLLAEIIKGAGAYSNVDFGGANAPNQEELHRCLKMMHPMTAGSVHTRVNTRWDLATVIRYLEGELGYKGLYTIETGNGHVGTREIYDVVVATLDTKT